MRRPAGAGVRSLAALTAAALVITACGSTTSPRISGSTASLCIDVGLASDSATGSLVMRGIHAVIGVDGLNFDGYHIHLCTDGYRGTGTATEQTEALVQGAVGAASDRRTIAFIGALSGAQATDADAVLAPAEIPLITPSTAVPAAMPAIRRAAGPAASPVVRSTSFSLLPPASSQIRAVQTVIRARGCASVPGRPSTPLRRPVRCRLEQSPLCAQPQYLAAPYPLLCVVPGAGISPLQTPAQAYGEAAADLVLSTLKRIAASGGDIADRSIVLGGLIRADLPSSPIGPIRFDAAGVIATDRYSVYTFRSDGQPVPSGTFTTH